MKTVLTGIYPDLASAEAAVALLVAEGVDRAAISVIVKSTPDHERRVLQVTDDTPRRTLGSAIAGGALASLAFATLALPGIGILAAGPIIAGLTGGSAGAVVGGIIGMMTGHGVSTMVAQEYEAAVGSGQVLVAVHTDRNQAKLVEQCFDATAAVNRSDAVNFANDRQAEGEA